jgi:hypothetical protein
MKMKSRLLITIALFGFLTTCFGQQSSAWEKWEWLKGEWVGVGTGQPGQGGGYFSFKTDLDDNILVRKAHTEFPDSGNRPSAIHNDLMIIYPGNQDVSPKAIYFDNEGHTINYLVSFSENSIVMTSEKVPDVPVFRLTYTLLDPETVNTKFEMSQDNVNFVTYIEGKSKKTK